MLFDPRFPTVNRTALLVEGMAPFFTWKASVGPDPDGIDDDDEFPQGHLYLLSDIQAEDMDGSLRKRYYEMIFLRELIEVSEDESRWPRTRNWKVFQDWFSWDWIHFPCDLGPDPLRRMIWKNGDEGFVEKP